MAESRWAWGGVVGPTVFVFAWMVAGTVEDGYSQADEAISRLAAVGASTRAPVSAALVVLGTGMLMFAAAVRQSAGGRWAASAAMVTGLATIGVAATPLGWTAAVDDLHGVLAVAGYASLAAVPMLAARGARLPVPVRLSMAVGIAGLACLLASVIGTVAPGALQRAGLTIVHAWVVFVALRLARSRTPNE
ncbi:MAG: DUF998 domain-containing protein [Actinomycetota bacterium]